MAPDLPIEKELCVACGEEGIEDETDDGQNLCGVCYQEHLDENADEE